MATPNRRNSARGRRHGYILVGAVTENQQRAYNISQWRYDIETLSASPKSNRVAGHDGLHAAFLKCSGDDMSTSLCNVFNASISSCDFHGTLKWADINLIYKKKDTHMSVDVLTVVSKVFERMSSDQLTDYFVSILNRLQLPARDYSYNSPNFSANPLIKEIVLELWQWICQRP